jgi:hypothetical protein
VSGVRGGVIRGCWLVSQQVFSSLMWQEVRSHITMLDDTLQQQTEAEKMLLEEEWSLIKKLPVKCISQLCRLVGIASACMKVQRLEKIKEWCEEWLNELEEAAGGVAEGEGQLGRSMSAALVVARAGK